MVSVTHFLSPFNQKMTEVNQKMKSNFYTKIPHYARDYKKEYLFIIGLNKEFKYLINKLDNLNNGLFESNISNRIKYNMKRFLRGQEKGKLKDISEFVIPRYDYLYIQDFCLNLYYEIKFYDNPSYKEFFDLIGKLYNKIKIELIFSDYYGEGFCI